MIHTKATRRKLSVMRRGHLNPFFGRHHSEETKRRLSAITRVFNSQRQYLPSPQKITIPVEPKLSYLAGIVDGEGSIRFRRGRPFVAVYNTNTELMKWLLLTIGGSVYRDGRGRTPGYQWQISAANDVLALCRVMLPRLIIKKIDAQSAILHLEKKYGHQN